VIDRKRLLAKLDGWKRQLGGMVVVTRGQGTRLLRVPQTFRSRRDAFEAPGHLDGGAIPEPNPDYLWRWPMQDAEPMKIFVLRHDQQSVVPRVGPDCTIGGRRQADVADVDGTGV